jgi:3-oxoacyl-[acyl-carrier protein] reductase
MAKTPLALITGSRKGIGQFLARHFVARGYAVVGCSREPADWSLDGYEHRVVDVTDELAVMGLCGVLRRERGAPAVLINNAGIAAMNHALLTPSATVEAIFRTNVLGTVLVSREVAKLMLPEGFGRIVNFSSVAVPLRLEGESAYAASKSAVETFTRILARELGPRGITVNAVGPAPTETDLTRPVAAQKIQDVIGRLAVGRAGTFEDIANVVDFLVRPESSAVTGQTIYLGGP